MSSISTPFILFYTHNTHLVEMSMCAKWHSFGRMCRRWITIVTNRWQWLFWSQAKSMGTSQWKNRSWNQ